MKRRWITISLCLALIGIASTSSPTADAQSTPADLGALRQEMESLKNELREIRKSLAEIAQILATRAAAPAPAAQAAPAITRISLGSGPRLGLQEAPITLVEFSDYQCPFCQRYSAATLPELKRDYIDTGKVRYVFRDFPLDSIHPQARKAAEAARCAGEQGKYWEMHDTLFKNQATLQVDNLKQFARTLGLAENQFNSCLDQGKYAQVVNEDVSAASAVGVTGTPSFFIGRTTQGEFIEGTRLVGAQPIASFRRIIDQLLSTKPGA